MLPGCLEDFFVFQEPVKGRLDLGAQLKAEIVQFFLSCFYGSLSGLFSEMPLGRPFNRLAYAQGVLAFRLPSLDGFAPAHLEFNFRVGIGTCRDGVSPARLKVGLKDSRCW